MWKRSKRCDDIKETTPIMITPILAKEKENVKKDCFPGVGLP